MATASLSPQQIEFLKKSALGILVKFFYSAGWGNWHHSDHAKVMEIAEKMVDEEIPNIWTIVPTFASMPKKGIEAIVMPSQYLWSMTVGPEKLEGEIREKGAVATIHDCPWRDAQSYFCVATCHMAADRVCKLTDPDYHCLCTHQLTLGDPFCRFILMKKSETYIDIESLGKVITKLPRVNITDEQVDQYRNYSTASHWVNNTIVFKMLNGSDKTIEVLCPNAKRIGKDFGTSLIEANMLPTRDIAVMGGFINMFGEGSGMQGKIATMTLDIFAKEITDCPFKKGPPEVCKQWEAFFDGVLENTNPDLEFHYDRMMTMGDKTCKWVISKR